MVACGRIDIAHRSPRLPIHKKTRFKVLPRTRRLMSRRSLSRTDRRGRDKDGPRHGYILFRAPRYYMTDTLGCWSNNETGAPPWAHPGVEHCFSFRFIVCLPRTQPGVPHRRYRGSAAASFVVTSAAKKPEGNRADATTTIDLGGPLRIHQPPSASTHWRRRSSPPSCTTPPERHNHAPSRRPSRWKQLLGCSRSTPPRHSDNQSAIVLRRVGRPAPPAAETSNSPMPCAGRYCGVRARPFRPSAHSLNIAIRLRAWPPAALLVGQYPPAGPNKQLEPLTIASCPLWPFACGDFAPRTPASAFHFASTKDTPILPHQAPWRSRFRRRPNV